MRLIDILPWKAGGFSLEGLGDFFSVSECPGTTTCEGSARMNNSRGATCGGSKCMVTGCASRVNGGRGGG